MAKRNALRDVDPVAITICKKGANRQRIFLRKAAPGSDVFELPAGEMPILKSAGADWTAFYCVVAEPGAEEDPGLTGDLDSIDFWESEVEIRKAAHRLLKNGAYVNAQHDSDAEPDCAIVESAIALSDFTLDGVDGEEVTIKKDSWYVAIEPGDTFREAIEKGEIGAVSLEGTGLRVPIEKSVASFAERIAASNLRDSLWSAWDALQSVIYESLNDEDLSAADRRALIESSLGEFKDYLVGRLNDAGAARLAKEIGTVNPNDPEDDDMGLAEDFAALKKTTDEKFEKLEKSSDATTTAVEGLLGLTEKLVERLEQKPEEKPEEKPADLKKVVKDLGELADQMDKFDGSMQQIAKSIEALGEGESSQDTAGDQLRKTNSDNPLAGLLA